MGNFVSLALTLRGRLILLICLAILPAILFTFYIANNERSAALQRTVEDARHIASLASREHLHQIAGAKSLLRWLGDRLSGEGNQSFIAQDSGFLPALLAGYPQLANIGVLTPKGEVIGSAYPLHGETNMADNPAVKRALLSHDVEVGTYTVSPIVGRPVLNLAYALRDRTDKIKGIVFIGLDLEWLQRLSKQTDLSNEHILLIVDREGGILSSSEPPREGMEIAGTLMSELAESAVLGNRTVKISWGGVPQIFITSPMEGIPGVLIASGLPYQRIYAQANAIFYRTLGGLGLLTLCTVISVLVAAEVTLLSSLRALSHASWRFGKGDFSARAPIPYGYGELQEMARAFNAMAETLSLRHREITEAHDRLNVLTRHLQMAREAEAQRIARDLHDEAGQVMTSIKIDLTGLRKKCAGDAHYHSCAAVMDRSIAEMTQKIDGVIDFIRRIASDLRPPVLDRMGVASAIELLAKETEKNTDLAIETDISGLDEPVDELVSITLYRITQEALTNIVRHAGATIVHIGLHQNEKEIVLTVKDDGRGMDDLHQSLKSLGIIGMQERARMVQGQCAIHSAPQEGTQITVTIPKNEHQGGEHAYSSG